MDKVGEEAGDRAGMSASRVFGSAMAVTASILPMAGLLSMADRTSEHNEQYGTRPTLNLQLPPNSVRQAIQSLLVFVCYQCVDDTSQEPGSLGCLCRLDFQAPRLGEVGVEEGFQQLVSQNNHPEGREREVWPMRILGY
jgi:hypothetical protein